MTYSAQYCALISNRLQHPLTDGYFELHHIIPKSEGGSNDADNLVRLTLREHFVAHKLLYKIYNDEKMALAFMFMSDRLESKNSKMYENARIAARPLLSECAKKMNEKLTPEQRAKIQHIRAIAGGKKIGKIAAKKMNEKLTFEQRSKIGKKGAASLTFEQRSKNSKNKKWWNNRFQNRFCKECPGPEWVLGLLRKKC